jgi:hypothetical protein
VFKVEFFVDDKHLGDALRALAGYARGQPNVVPVVNAKMANGHIKADIPAGNMVELFAAYLKKNKLETLKAQDIKDFLKTIGRSPQSANYLTRLAVAQKILRRSGKTSNIVYYPIKG